MPYISDKRLYLDANGKVTDEPPESGTLLVGEGGELPDDVAAKYGLTKKHAASADKAEQHAPETKAVKGPPEDKSK